MALFFYWLSRIVFLTIIICSLGFIGGYYILSRSVIDYNTDYQIDDAISGKIKIVRDSYAVPHIFADYDNDIYFGLGFAHAQDRLWQMLLLRRTAQGRLSELFGKKTLKVDEFMRRLNLYTLSHAAEDYQYEQAKNALNAYANGINAWLKIMQKHALGRGAPELFLFTPKIAPWTPTDSIALIRLLHVQFSNKIKEEILRTKVQLTVGAERTHDIFPDIPISAQITLSDSKVLFPNFSQEKNFTEQKPIFLLENSLTAASNAWAANGSRSTHGMSLLANDPHVALTAPSLWMLARLGFTDGNAIGATIPGIPAIISGRNPNLAWGITYANIDDADLYIEQLNPDNPQEYLTPQGYKPFKTKEIIIDIKDSVGKVINLRWSENGPILAQNNFGLKEIVPPNHVISVAWTALHPEDRSLSSIIAIMRSKSIEEARKNGKDFYGPGQNLILADKINIAIQTIGRLPQRNIAHITKGRIPSQGWLIRNRWKNYFPYSKNPFIINPSSGIVANTNNKITDADFPLHISYDWGDSQRIQRLTKLLNTRKVHTRDSFVEAQLDTVSFTARALLPLIAKELWFTAQSAPANIQESNRKTALNLLANWNGEMNQHIAEPLIFMAWLRNLQKQLIIDDLGLSLAKNFSNIKPIFIERVFRNIDGAAQWCDIRPSKQIEMCSDIADIALDFALFELSQSYGDDINQWRWGLAHQAQQDHQILGNNRFMNWFVNIRQEISGGDNTLQNARIAGVGENPYASTHAAGYRSVIDFSDPNSSLYIISTGQSGNFLSPHYDDLAKLWKRGEYIPMSLDPTLAHSNAAGITILSPKK